MSEEELTADDNWCPVPCCCGDYEDEDDENYYENDDDSDCCIHGVGFDEECPVCMDEEDSPSPGGTEEHGE